MNVAYGVPELPSTRLTESAFVSNVRRVLRRMDGARCAKLWRNVEEAMNQRRGTMLVVSENAESEALRLHTQSVPVQRVDLTPDLLRRVSEIDGAVLIDPDCRCVAIGVILDGLATEKGDSSRGARYNSAVRYVESSAGGVLCLVVSEDGHVDMVPTLRPQISRAEVQTYVSQLARQTRENYHQSRTWLDKHRFYLTREQCNAVNIELDRIHKEPLRPGKIGLTTYRFEPDPEMNETYYLKEISDSPSRSD